MVMEGTGFPGGSVLKNLPAVQETQVQHLGWEDPLEEKMANHSNIFAHEQTEEPMGQRCLGVTVHRVARVRHDLATKQKQISETGWLKQTNLFHIIQGQVSGWLSSQLAHFPVTAHFLVCR